MEQQPNKFLKWIKTSTTSRMIMIGFLSFVLIVAFFALYHWRIGYIMIRNYIKKSSIHKGIENDWVYNIFISMKKPFLHIKKLLILAKSI